MKVGRDAGLHVSISMYLYYRSANDREREGHIVLGFDEGAHPSIFGEFAVLFFNPPGSFCPVSLFLRPN